MKLVRKLGLTFLCCLPVGAATSGYELNSREEISDAEEGSETNLPVETSLEVNSLETEVAEASKEEEDHVESISSPVDSNEIREDTESSGPENMLDAKIAEPELSPSSVLPFKNEEQIYEITVSEEENTVTNSEDKESQNEVSIITELKEELSPKQPEGVKLNNVEDTQKEISSNNEELSQPITTDNEKDKNLESTAAEELPAKSIDNENSSKVEEDTKSEVDKSKTEEKLIPDNNTKEELKDFSVSEPVKPFPSQSKASQTRVVSERERKVREIIGVVDGPITKSNVRGGLLKLHTKKSKSRLSAHEQQMYIFLMKLLGEFERFKKIVTVI